MHASKHILITDPHITKPGQLIIGLDPAERLSTVLDHAIDHHPDADGLIVMGDLVHRGSRVEYRRIKAILDQAPWPIILMPGNHDRRAGFAEIFSQTFQQNIIDTPTHRIICLDTLDDDPPLPHMGILCAARIADLNAALARTDAPCIIITHHPLGPVGFDGMDRIGLQNAAEVLDILCQSGKAVQIISGHVHRHVSGTWGKMPFTILPSTCHQMPLALDDTSSGSSVDEPAAYGVLLTCDAGTVVHVAQVGADDAEIVQDPAST